ncbi:NADP-dependent oxidoreductase domain-containing protein [Gymnopilus junonius]|uniref:NADP-dependent oxidoreductase domain-containing protein n=1 Tax=Gymnopilus junonius TaxID=109634 RepID=A0A9P5NHB7_GYMJU|nr:NADP-dependent oxidoreductase domain-containing protein [Gymnopilus junonius]
MAICDPRWIQPVVPDNYIEDTDTFDAFDAFGLCRSQAFPPLLWFIRFLLNDSRGMFFIDDIGYTDITSHLMRQLYRSVILDELSVWVARFIIHDISFICRHYEIIKFAKDVLPGGDLLEYLEAIIAIVIPKSLVRSDLVEEINKFRGLCSSHKHNIGGSAVSNALDAYMSRAKDVSKETGIRVQRKKFNWPNPFKFLGAFGSGSVNKGKDIHQYVEQALDTGFSHIDAAQHYANEQFVGLAIRNSGIPRAELFVTSKWGSGSVQDAFQASLKNLGLAYLDLYLIHTPNSVPNGDFEVHGGIRNLKQDGLTRYEQRFFRSIGVSNFTVKDLQKLLKIAKVKPAVNQIRLHPYNYAENATLLEYQAKHGIITEAYGSLAPITTYPGGPVDAHSKPLPLVSASHPRRSSSLGSRQGRCHCTTSSSKEHLKEYLAVGDLPALTEEEVAAIDKAGAQGPPSSFLHLLRPTQRIQSSSQDQSKPNIMFLTTSISTSRLRALGVQTHTTSSHSKSSSDRHYMLLCFDVVSDLESSIIGRVGMPWTGSWWGSESTECMTCL